MAANQVANNAQGFFEAYCKSKKYQLQKSVINNAIKLEISNNKDRTIVLIYHTGKIVMGGSKNTLKQEFESLKDQFEQTPGAGEEKSKACTVNYDILLETLREKLKTSMVVPDADRELIVKPTGIIEWQLKFSRNRKSATLNQFKNGTLSIQGKEDDLLDEICDVVEKIIDPSEKEIVARFVSGDEQVLQKCTPEIIQVAENNIKTSLGAAYGFIEIHDQKLFIAAECLCLAKVPLPEFSPLVMPASKAFEGFIKKLSVSIGLCDAAHFQQSNANISFLNDTTNPRRINVCSRDKNIDALLKQVNACLTTNRHFMMHSDGSVITKVEKLEEGIEKARHILLDTKTVFDSFNKLFGLI